MFKVMLGSTESEVSLGYRGLCLKRKRKKKRKHVKKKKKNQIQSQKGRKVVRARGQRGPEQIKVSGHIRTTAFVTSQVGGCL